MFNQLQTGVVSSLFILYHPLLLELLASMDHAVEISLICMYS